VTIGDLIKDGKLLEIPAVGRNGTAMSLFVALCVKKRAPETLGIVVSLAE
jgi:hypothetical protein